MPPASRSIEFQAEDGVRLHAIEWSKNSARDSVPPLILLHGGGANAHWWDCVAPSLAGSCGFNPVFCLDFRGHGDSEYPAEHRVGAFSSDLEALLEWLGRTDVALVGHSLGAAVALDHASRFAQTKALALIDLARGSGRSMRRRSRLALSLRRSYRSHDEAVERFRFLPESSHATEALRRHIAEHSVAQDSDGRFAYKFDPAWFALPSKPRPERARVTCPTLLVRGAESSLLSTEAASEFISQIARGKLIEIARAGHHVLIDQPAALRNELVRFLQEIE